MSDRNAAVAQERPRLRPGEGGFTLVEALVALLVLAVSILGTLSTVVSVAALEQRTAAQDASDRAARDTLEQIVGLDPAAALAQYRAAPQFKVGGESVKVDFPAAELTATLPKLQPATTCFADLDHDGMVDVNSSNASAPGLLPVRIVIGSGSAQVTIQTMVLKP